MTTDNKPKKRVIRIIIILGLIAVLLAVAVAGVLLWKLPPKAERLRRKGLISLNAQNHALAVRYLRDAVALEPNNFEAREGLIQALCANKEFVEAFAEVSRATALGYPAHDAAILQARILQGRAHYRMASAGKLVNATLIEDIIAHEINPALKLCADNMAQVKNKVDGHAFVGGLYLAMGRLLATQRAILLKEAESHRVAQKIEAAKEKLARARMALVSMQKVGRQATLAYETAMALDAKATAPRMALARMAVGTYMPQANRAIKLLEPVIAQYPDSVKARFLMAEAERLLGHHEKALAHLRSLPADQRNVKIIAAEGRILLDLERWDEAETLLAPVVADNPNNILLSFLHGKALLYGGKPEDALNLIQKVFSRPDRHWPEARYDFADALLRTGKREQALTAFMAVLTDMAVVKPRNAKESRKRRKIRYDANMTLARELDSSSAKAAAKHAQQAFMLFPERTEALDLARGLFWKLDRNNMADDLLLLHVAALSVRQSPDAALKVCREELKQPGVPAKRLRRLMARICARKGAFREATKIYEQLWRNNQDDIAVGLELARLKSHLGLHPEALRICGQLARAHPRNLKILSARVTAMLANGQNKEAAALLKRYSKGTKSGAVRNLLLQIYLKDGRMAEAVDLARLHTRANPDSAQAHALLGGLLLRDGQTDEARKSLHQARKLDRKNKASYWLGLLFLAEGDYIAAEKLFREAVEYIPKWSGGHMYLGLSLWAKGDTKQALNVLETALASAKPGQTVWDTVRWFLAIMHAGQGDSKQAITFSKKILLPQYGLASERETFLRRLVQTPAATRPRLAMHCYLLLAFAHEGLDKYARSHLTQIQKRQPAIVLPACWFGQALAKAGKLKESVIEGKKIVQAHPQLILARVALAESKKKSGDVSGAIKEMEHALQLMSDNADAAVGAHIWLGSTYESEAQFDVAIAHYQAAIKARPDNPVALNNLAWLLATHKNDPSAALPLAERALRKSGPNPIILDTLGWTYYLKGDFDKAVKVLEHAKARFGTNPNIRYHLGMTYIKLDRRKEAKTELQEALGLSDDFDHADTARKALKSL